MLLKLFGIKNLKIFPILDMKIKNLKISVRVLNKKDIEDRNLPKDSSGLIITNIKSIT